jgi:hypothetical protein
VFLLESEDRKGDSRKIQRERERERERETGEKMTKIVKRE